MSLSKRDEVVDVQITKTDVSALRREMLGVGRTHAARGTGDKGDLVVETEHHDSQKVLPNELVTAPCLWIRISPQYLARQDSS